MGQPARACATLLTLLTLAAMGTAASAQPTAAQPAADAARAAAAGGPAPQAAAVPTPELLARARAATDRRDFNTALPLFEQLVQRAPADADLLIEAARVFGWADRNARAAALYRQALAAAPARRADIVPSLAWQTLWAGDTAAALPLLQEATALQPSDRALAWARANALNHAGRHREALALFQRWAPSANESERVDLARSLRWAGFEDRAWPLLREATTPEARWLRDYRLARDVAPYAYASHEISEDRDGLKSRGTSVGAGMLVLGGITAELGAQRLALDDSFGAASASTFEASGRVRLGEPDAAGGTWWPQLVLRSHRIDGWSPLNFTARIKGLPADGWRVDAEHTRELVPTPRAYANRVTVDVTSLGADWRRDERLSAAAALALLKFDDGTTRQRFNGRVEWALVTRPRWHVGAEWSGFERTREGAPGSDARGYWNPRRYEEARLVTGIQWELRPFDLQARAGLARSREIDGSGSASRGAPHLWELAAAVDTAPSWRLRASVGGSGQGLGLGNAGGSGARYWRRWAQLGANAWF
jgi:tetratricopeptide (TPR) repeat protein